MQNNQHFLEKMQGLLSFTSLPQTEPSSSESHFKTQEYDNSCTPNRQNCNNFNQFQSQQIIGQDANYLVDPYIQGMFSSEQKQIEDSMINEMEVGINQNGVGSLIQENTGTMDPNMMMNPEYVQMFNQFYQVFIQLQQQIQDQQIDPTNENFLNVMTQFFLQIIQQQHNPNDQFGHFGPQQLLSKQPIIDYTNLPLASIPESKESILEENSGWHNTVQTRKNMIASSLSKESQSCSCCHTCIDQKRNIQHCSNFNAGVLNQDTFIQRSDISSGTSQILGNPFCNSYTPSPNINRTTDIYSRTSLQVNQNLNQIFQQQVQQQQQQQQQQNQVTYYYPSQQQDLAHDQQLYQQYLSIPHSPEDQNNLIVLSTVNEGQVNSPNEQQNNQMLSPEQMKQNRLIEYMIDNNDFSNYKHRRCVIKGERMSRTLSRSGNKSSLLMMHRQQQSLPNINPILPNYSNQNSIYQQIIQDECPLNEDKGAFSPQQEIHHQREPFHFFSPQLPSKPHQFFTAKNSFEDTLITHQNEQIFSPGDTNGEKKRKKTQEKIKEIRRLNEQQREQKPFRKNQFKKNVFEINDLKKSKSRKTITHNRKQSYNVGGNKENQKLLQSNFQTKFEMSEENIIHSENYDLINEKSQDDQREDNPDTFKSLKSVWKSGSSNFYHHIDSKRTSVEQLNQQISPQITNLKISQLRGSDSLRRFTDNNEQMASGMYDLRILPMKIEKAPGQEVHIIKKPVQTDELKRIQERLNKYYKDKKKDEEEINKLKQIKNQHQPENETVMSMTKTLSSFKSLMMKTMSQMSMQQDNNIQQQYVQGQKQRQMTSQNPNASMNVSSIHDDYSVGGELSENFTRIISPKHLYNGHSIKHRNAQNPSSAHINNGVSASNNPSFKNLMLSPTGQEKYHQQSASCLPNVLFFQQKDKQEDTLSLKYNSRQPSLCNCGKQMCICEQKKDLLGHFQNFLQEMDKQQIPKNKYLRESIMPSPITTLNNNTQDFLISNYQGRSSSQHSLRGVIGSSRQSTNSSSLPKMKRFSSGSHLINLPMIKNSAVSPTSGLETNQQQHYQSTKIILTPTIKMDSSPISRNSINIQPEQSLQKLDTNKEEEIRLLNIENDMMHKAFIVKSHRLNLQQNQRDELLQRIQKYKEGQLVRNNSSEGTISSQAAATTQNSSQTSLEERRKLSKFQKQVTKIQQNQSQREIEFIGNDNQMMEL